MFQILIAQARQDEARSELMHWAMWLIVAMVVFWGIAAYVRRRTLDPTEMGGMSLSFGLDDLRRMREEGQISEAEYERCRAKIIAKARGPVASSESSESEDVSATPNVTTAKSESVPEPEVSQADAAPAEDLGPELLSPPDNDPEDGKTGGEDAK